MFCEKCGNELSEGVRFCSKCGNPIQTGTVAQPVTTQEISASSTNKKMEKEVKREKGKEKKGNIIKRYINRWKRCKQEKFKGKKNIGWVAVNAIVVLLIVGWIHWFLNYNINMNGLVYMVNSDGTATVTNWMSNNYNISLPLLGEEINIPSSVRIGFKTYDVTDVLIADGGRINLTGLSNVERFHCDVRFSGDYIEDVTIHLEAMPHVKNVYVWCPEAYIDVVGEEEHNALEYISIEGQYSRVELNTCTKLESIDVRGGDIDRYDGPVSLQLMGEFPKLIDITTNAFPWLANNFLAENLEKVSLDITNKQLSEKMNFDGTMRSDYLYLTSVPNVEWNVSHTIEDLYGTWKCQDSPIAFTFQENGYVRISDDQGLLGLDLLTFSELDDNTLLLKAETANAWGDLVTIEMPYEIFGKQLKVSILGNDLMLLRD